ncbi:MAG: hypothetical protein K8L99_09795 [Anaerolineae bacterium]|nr:hypothetical protein [Anaerolineae bacterium]
MTKISIIGAGSAVFSLNLVRDICLTPNLAGSTLTLMDIDEARLEAVYELCRRYADEIGTTLHLERTTDRREALAGSAFVINTALVAGHERMRAGWNIARRYGYRMGGSLHIFHDEAFWINFYQYQLFESLVQDMLEICPDAYLLLVANPVLAGITYLGRKYPQLKMVGLCHGFSGIYYLAQALGLEREHITFQIPGVNHFVWLTHFYYKGEDAFPLIDRWIETGAPAHWEQCHPSDSLGLAAVDLYKRYGVFPIGDTCTPGGGSWPFWYHTDEMVERQWHEDPMAWWSGYFRHLETHVAQIKAISEDQSRKVSDAFPPKKSGEVIIDMVESIACDIPRVLIGNIPNSGDFVPDVPRDFAVEIPLLVSKRGIQGIKTDGLPAPVMTNLLRDRVAPVNTELEAYAQGSYEALLQLVLMDPFTNSLEQAEHFLDEVLALPFHEAMRQHFRKH